jgi:hypothetical protein
MEEDDYTPECPKKKWAHINGGHTVPSDPRKKKPPKGLISRLISLKREGKKDRLRSYLTASAFTKERIKKELIAFEESSLPTEIAANVMKLSIEDYKKLLEAFSIE